MCIKYATSRKTHGCRFREVEDLAEDCVEEMLDGCNACKRLTAVWKQKCRSVSCLSIASHHTGQEESKFIQSKNAFTHTHTRTQKKRERERESARIPLFTDAAWIMCWCSRIAFHTCVYCLVGGQRIGSGDSAYFAVRVP